MKQESDRLVCILKKDDLAARKGTTGMWGENRGTGSRKEASPQTREGNEENGHGGHAENLIRDS